MHSRHQLYLRGGGGVKSCEFFKNRGRKIVNCKNKKGISKRGNEIKSRALNHSYYFLEENLKLPTKGKKQENKINNLFSR